MSDDQPDDFDFMEEERELVDFVNEVADDSYVTDDEEIEDDGYDLVCFPLSHCSISLSCFWYIKCKAY